MTDAEFVAWTEKYAAKYEQLRVRAGDVAARLWLAQHGLDDAALNALLDVLVPTVDAISSTAGQLAALHVGAATGEPNLVDFASDEFTTEALRSGKSARDVFARPMIRARTLISEGQSYDQARRTAAEYARELASTNVMLANRAGARKAMMTSKRVVGYRRVLTGKSCPLCVAASTQRYHRSDLMPIHRRCDCGIAPIVGEHDPGQIINQGLLDTLQKSSPTYWKNRGLLDADGHPVEQISQAAKPGLATDPELGPVLTPALQLSR